VRVFSYARIPFESIVRNGKRSMMAMLGTIMAIVLISGSLVAVDSAASGLVTSVLDAMPYDMDAAEAYPVPEINGTLFEEHATILEEVDGVDKATTVAVFGSLDYQNPNGTTTDDHDGSVVMIPAGDEGLLDTYSIEGSVPDPGTVAIGLYTSRALNLGVGDYINIVARISEYDPVNMTYYFRNLTIALKISEVWSQEQIEIPNVQGGMSIWYQYDDSIYLAGLDPVVMRLEDAALVADPMKAFMGSMMNLMVWHQISVDREEIIRLGDLPGTLDRLHRLEGRLDRAPVRTGSISETI